MPRVSEEYLEARRNQILDAAVVCFSRLGFHEATLAHICEQADLSRGAVYHYFKSKEHIIDALRVRSAAEESAALDAAASARDPAERLAELNLFVAERMARSESADPNRLAAFIWAEALTNEQIREGQVSATRPWRATLEQLVRELQEQGRVNPDVGPRDLSVALVGALLGIQLQMLWEPDLDVEAACRALNAMLAGNFWLGEPASTASPSSGRRGSKSRPGGRKQRGKGS